MDIPSEKIREAYSRAPFPIREYLASGEIGTLAQKMAHEYQLHVDTTGALADILTKTLLGLLSPHELPEALARSIGIPDASLNPFIERLNAELFKPLQQKVREEGSGPPKEERVIEPAPAIPAPASAPARPEIPPMQIGAPPPAPAPLPQPPPAAPPVPAVVPEAPREAVSSAQVDTPIYRQVDATDYLPHARTMAEDMRATSQGMHGTPVTPARSFQTASVPVTSAPAFAKAPPVLPPPAPAAPPIAAPVRLTPVDRPYANAPITKEYGSDPYREPIE